MHTRTWLAVLMLAAALACSREQQQKVQQKADAVKDKVADAVDDIATPFGKSEPVTPQQREQQRFDQQWRQLQSFRAQQAAQQQAAPAQPPAPAPPAAVNVQFAARGKQKETFKGLDANAINNAPVLVPISGDVLGPSVLKAQVYLDRNHFSVGALDGRWGRNSAITVWWWQRAHGLPETGDVDEATFRSLAAAAGGEPAVKSYTVTADDVKGPFVHLPESPYEKAKLDCLCYESALEGLAEKFHCTTEFLELLNPNVKFSELQAGTPLVVPNVRDAVANDLNDIAKVTISVAGNSFNAWNANGNLIFHAPTTLGSTFDPSPDETVKMVKMVRLPHFHYDPTLYHEVPDSEPDAHLNPGPNSPVGVVWMALSKPHYGIHGTPDPDSIGYASSHGCIRLTNWDAFEVSHRITPGVQISFVDTRTEGMPEIAKKE